MEIAISGDSNQSEDDPRRPMPISGEGNQGESNQRACWSISSMRTETFSTTASSLALLLLPAALAPAWAPPRALPLSPPSSSSDMDTKDERVHEGEERCDMVSSFSRLLLRETQPRHPMNEDMSLSTLLASDILRANSAWLASMRCARGWRGGEGARGRRGGGVAPKSAPPARVGSQRAIAPNQRAIAPNQAHSGARARAVTSI